MSKQNKILVIATAAVEGGALTILLQFLATIPKEMVAKYILFVSVDFSEEDVLSTFTCYKFNTSKWRTRIWYDIYGYYKAIKKHKLDVKLCINFQNIPSRLKNIKQIVYMHQSLPFYDYKWNLFNKKESKYWLYYNFYLFFIRINKNFADRFIVQAEWIAKALTNKIKYPRDNVLICKPGVSPVFKMKSFVERKVDSETKIFIYPAALYEYKNHKVLFKSLSMVGASTLLLNNVRVIFTVRKNAYLEAIVSSYGISECIDFIGTVSHQRLSEIYDSAYCLLFPSKIESFGLPLIEAAQKGMNIISSDLPYAKEAMKDYKSAHFIDPDDASLWADEIKKIIGANVFSNDSLKYEDDWPNVHVLIGELYAFKDVNS